MCQWFSPTSLKITFEAKGMGAVPKDVAERMVMRDKEGKVVSLNLPPKFVYIGNHQVSCHSVSVDSSMFDVPQGLLRLVVCLVLVVLCPRRTQTRVYYLEEEPEMGSCCRMGMYNWHFPNVTAYIPPGNAILRLYISSTFMGLRSDSTGFTSLGARENC